MLGIHNLERKQLALASDRPHHRVDVPMIVEIDNTRHSASEWTVTGFALDKPLPGLNSETSEPRVSCCRLTILTLVSISRVR